MPEAADGAGVGDGDALELQRSALLRSVSHDLRTPLTAIRAIVTDLHDGVVHDPATQSALLQTVCDEIDRLDRLVGNLLSMSRIRAGVLEPRHEAVDVAELVDHRLRALAPLVRGVDVTVDLAEGLPAIDGDFAQLEEVLTNLLANAVRHAPGSDLTVRARTAWTAGGTMVELAVVDHGPGIDPAAAARLFEAFAPGSTSRSTGLGLAICSAIASAHGGSIVVEATPGGGATFVVRLPARPPSPAPAEAPVDLPLDLPGDRPDDRPVDLLVDRPAGEGRS